MAVPYARSIRVNDNNWALPINTLIIDPSMFHHYAPLSLSLSLPLCNPIRMAREEKNWAINIWQEIGVASNM